MDEVSFNLLRRFLAKNAPPFKYGMPGREVTLTFLTEDHACGDCEADAVFHVADPTEGPWYWCGVRAVGE